MNVDLVNKIKQTAIIALASDDELVETLVLKGGNAIDLAYRHSTDTISRTSYDLDYSIEDGDFSEDEEDISNRIKKTLSQTFLEKDLVVIDYKFLKRPSVIPEAIAGFWGGYLVEFKVVDKKIFDAAGGDIEKIRRGAVPLHPKHSPVFELEFSKYEYVGDKLQVDVEGYKLYVYTPEMIVFEKLRAICQQLPQYRDIIPSFSPRARARDFYDIHLIIEMHNINPASTENIELIKNIFKAKKVPLHYIKEIKNHKAIHQDNWRDVLDTISAYEKPEPFDYYFNFLLEKFESLTFP